MRGRTPKDPDQRSRRNRAVTAADLEAPVAGEIHVPPLPPSMFPGGTRHRLTLKWWKIIWASPMAPRWLEADVEGLYLIAILRNEFFMKPTPTLAAEIRQQETRFGLTPIDRRRLDWRIEGPRVAMKQQEEGQEAAEPERPEDDPRRFLRAVQ